MKKSKETCDLKTCMLCRSCLPEWLAAVGAHRSNLLFGKGETIFSEGDKVNGIYFVYSGKVKVHKKWGSEKELIIRFAQKGDLFGHRGLGHDPYYPISATALEAVSACHIDLAFFRASLKVNVGFTERLLLFFADELQVSERKMRDLAHMQVKGRVAQALLNLQAQFGDNGEGYLNINLSRQDLAAYAGTTYETVFRIINELSAGGLIETKAKSIRIVRRDGLAVCCNEREPS
jgi:CRP-like cAMP-binding protein